MDSGSAGNFIHSTPIDHLPICKDLSPVLKLMGKVLPLSIVYKTLPLTLQIFKNYSDYAVVFCKKQAEMLPPHRPYNYLIDSIIRTISPQGWFTPCPCLSLKICFRILEKNWKGFSP